MGEQPYCTSIPCLSKLILKVEKNPTGGFLTYFEGSKYPINSYPQRADLNYLDTIKRVLMASMRLVISMPLTPHRIIRGIQKWMGDIYSADHGQNPNRFTIENWVESTKAILDALVSCNTYENDEWCHYLAAIWDGDLAYRFRGMDVLQNLNKENLRKSPKREIMRLVDLAISREINKEALSPGGKVKMAKNILKIALLSKEFRKLAIGFLTNLDIEKMKFDINEQYWLANKFDYNYEGKTYEERTAWKAEEDKDFAPEKQKEEKVLPRISINPPNQEFYDLSPEDAQTMIVNTAKVLRDDWLKHQKNAEIARKN
jgi:hypothetical protein